MNRRLGKFVFLLIVNKNSASSILWYIIAKYHLLNPTLKSQSEIAFAFIHNGNFQLFFSNSFI